MVTARPDPRDLLATAIAVVRPAADQVQRMREAAREGVSTKSTETDVVTAADRAVERDAVAALRRARPHDTILGEEFGEAREPNRDLSGEAREPNRDLSGEAREPNEPDGADGAVRWLLDPIDGTVNYLYGLPWYSVSLAAEVDGRVVAGVVHNPVTGQEWTAVAGQGAWRDGVRLTGSRQTRLSQALVATGFAYDPARRAYQARVVAGLLAEVRDIRRLGSASLDLCLAAEGAFDAYFEKGLNPWDHAAGGLIAAEAGLTVAGLAGRPAGAEMLVAAPAALFALLHERLVALDASGGP